MSNNKTTSLWTPRGTVDFCENLYDALPQIKGQLTVLCGCDCCECTELTTKIRCRKCSFLIGAKTDRHEAIETIKFLLDYCAKCTGHWSKLKCVVLAFEMIRLNKQYLMYPKFITVFENRYRHMTTGTDYEISGSDFKERYANLFAKT